MNDYRKRAEMCVSRARMMLADLTYTIELDPTAIEEFDKYIAKHDYANAIVEFFEAGKIRAANDFLSICITPSSVGEDVILFDAINNTFNSLYNQVEF